MAQKSGWLVKEGGRYKSWKRRFMVIEGSDLAYYKKENRKERCGVIPLATVTQIGPVDYKGRKNCFHLVTPMRAYHIIATSQSEMDGWIKALRAVQSVDGQPIINLNSTAIPPAAAAALDDEIIARDMQGDKKIGLEEFELLKVIGKGSFGKVILVRKKEGADRSRVFAMKVLNKKTIVERNEVEHTKSEKSILMKLEFPFLVKLHYSFQTSDKLYFIMDYINGGELFFHLQKEKRFSEDRVRFYAAEIVAGLEYLHSAGVIYRDLKPENLLLTHEGHIVMTDFGLSKEGLHERDDRTGTFCGTPEYLAPEVLEGKGYGKAVDWWSFGTLMYEMLTGLPPFYCEDVQQMYTKIMTAELETPDSVSPQAADLLAKLLDRNPDTRLQDPPQIKKHPFFQPIDFEKLIKKQIRPPFVPEVRGEDDTSNIDSMFTDEPVSIEEDEPATEGTGQSFEGFTYVGGS
jgi:RAC serine/threonine-protein kinase